MPRRYLAHVYLGSDNYVPLTLTDGGLPIVGGISDLTRAVATLSQNGQSNVVVDSVTAPEAFDWLTEADASVIRLIFGGQAIPQGLWTLRLETYDNAANVVWCDVMGSATVQLRVVEAP